MFIMTEKRLRAIIRDEVELIALKEGGLYDEMRATAFSTCRATMTMQARQVLKSFEGRGETQSPPPADR